MKMHLTADLAMDQRPLAMFSTSFAPENIDSADTPTQIDNYPAGPNWTKPPDYKPMDRLQDVTQLHINSVDTVINGVDKTSHTNADKKLEQRIAKAKSRSEALMPQTSAERNLYRMNKLQEMIPELRKFDMHHKIGSGTFSNVYLASLKSNRSMKYAIKHHIQTAMPARIEWEYKCLQNIGGSGNVCGIQAAFRHNDFTVFVMPYIHHKRFSDYMLEMGVSETREYIRGLLTALARVHSFNIIHRDVKPSNYLYNRKTKEYMLVDFGLANESYRPSAPTSASPLLLEYSKRKRSVLCDDGNTGNLPKRRALQTRLNDNNIVQTDLSNNSARKNRLRAENRPPSVERPSHVVCKKLFPVVNDAVSHLLAQQTAFVTPEHKVMLTATNETNGALMAPRKALVARASKVERNNVWKTPKAGGVLGDQGLKTAVTERAAFQTLMPSNKQGVSFVRVQNSQMKTMKARASHNALFASPAASKECTCFGKPRVCGVCMQRPVKAAPRAGTPGFRPPEVLFKYRYQTTAVDMWAAGVILLCIMSGSYPFFKSPDDLAALSEITMVFGSDKVKEVAKKLGRHVQFSETKQPLNMRKLCEALRGRGVGNGKDLNCSSTTSNTSDYIYPESAYDLLSSLMDLNPHSRISAADALKHPFLAE